MGRPEIRLSTTRSTTGTAAALVFALSLLLAKGAGAAAVNLLVNPGFDTDTLNWQAPLGWSPTDASGSPHSGSLRVVAPPLASSNGGQCVAITGGTSYALSVKARLDGALGPNEYAYVGILFFATPDCTGGHPIKFPPYATSAVVGRWLSLTKLETAPPDAKSAFIGLGSYNGDAAGLPEVTVNYDDPVLTVGTCAPGPLAVCLSDGRFRVEASWNAPGRPGGSATAVALGSDSASFSFFDPDAADLAVKIVNGCGVNQRFWVFAGGLTNVGVKLTVTDTRTGKFKKYSSSSGKLFAPIADSNAFATCP